MTENDAAEHLRKALRLIDEVLENKGAIEWRVRPGPPDAEPGWRVYEGRTDQVSCLVAGSTFRGTYDGVVVQSTRVIRLLPEAAKTLFEEAEKKLNESPA